ncbi:MAG: cobalamin-dependent protein [Planctomycetes bacterium]|nr:cobalamin-dependent protein [Planctomycetota bacterium]
MTIANTITPVLKKRTGTSPGDADSGAPGDSTRSQSPFPTHPLGSRARVLLTSVFGPYAQDDEYGSRKINPMELYHNQVTRVQGVFSLRMFHRSWGLMLIQANIAAPCTLLDFPDMGRFVAEITTNQYDIVGISSIIPNVGKVRKMCELIRAHRPAATIVVGGHVANLPDLDERIDADHIVNGDGVRWMRRFLGEDESQAIYHPRITSGIGARILGKKQSDKPGEVAATLIPSVGCPMGCNFCSTSAMFGGKGKCVHFYETGDELFEVMCDLERDLGVKSFFVMDENFLMHRKRALRLLELMREHGKSWALYVFSSANALRSYTMEQLVGLGIFWVWMGLEGKDSQYGKLSGTDTHELVRTLQSHGIRVLGSSIIGLEEHTPENIDAAIDHAVSHNTDFHQFMLYTPIPGTPLYAEHEAAGTLLDPGELSYADTHGQHRFNYRHPHIAPGQETEFLLRAFQRDFEVNGPSLIRLTRTMLEGWRRYKDHPERRIRQRYAWDTRGLATMYSGALWATRHWYRDDPALSAKIVQLLKDIYREFGLKSRLAASLVGRYLRSTMAREARRLRQGWTYEPPTFYETNQTVAAGSPGQQSAAKV